MTRDPIHKADGQRRKDKFGKILLHIEVPTSRIIDLVADCLMQLFQQVLSLQHQVIVYQVPKGIRQGLASVEDVILAIEIVDVAIHIMLALDVVPFKDA